MWKSAFVIARGAAKVRSQQHLSLVGPGPSVPEPLSTVDEDYPHDLIRALAELSSQQRQAVVPHHYAGFRVSEVADMIDCSPSSVKVHLFRGRNRLRQLLSEATNDD